LAAKGLDELGVDRAVADRYLEILYERASTEQNGAKWQINTMRKFESGGLDRKAAITEMTRLYNDHMLSAKPVHTWPIG
jgi:hypothetical protein